MTSTQLRASTVLTDLDHDRKDQRPAAGAVVHELADSVVEVLLEQLDLEDVLGQAAVEHLLGLRSHLVHQELGVDEAARDHLGRRARPAVGGRQRGDDDENAVLGEPAPVAQGDVADVTDGEPVDEGHP